VKLKTLFTLNGVIAVGYAIAFFVATGPLLAIYGIAPNAEAVFTALVRRGTAWGWASRIPT
jgi:hypothetical protein